MGSFKRILIATALLFSTSLFAGNFGLGVIVGEPTGLAAAWKISPNHTHIAMALAYNFGDSGYLRAHADYVRYVHGLIPVNKGKLPFHFGLGALVGIGNDLYIGGRIPLGLTWQIDPLDVFIEVVPTVSLLPGTGFGVGAGLGARYYF
jgi:hypothetical protein